MWIRLTQTTNREQHRNTRINTETITHYVRNKGADYTVVNFAAAKGDAQVWIAVAETPEEIDAIIGG